MNPYYEPYWLNDEELEHFGVKGMKWGKRKKEDPAKLKPNTNGRYSVDNEMNTNVGKYLSKKYGSATMPGKRYGKTGATITIGSSGFNLNGKIASSSKARSTYDYAHAGGSPTAMYSEEDLKNVAALDPEDLDEAERRQKEANKVAEVKVGIKAVDAMWERGTTPVKLAISTPVSKKVKNAIKKATTTLNKTVKSLFGGSSSKTNKTTTAKNAKSGAATGIANKLKKAMKK